MLNYFILCPPADIRKCLDKLLTYIVSNNVGMVIIVARCVVASEDWERNPVSTPYAFIIQFDKTQDYGS